MTGDITMTTPPAPRWVCPTPDLDLSDLEWSAIKVDPDTWYEDEPSEKIQPGWYIHGSPRDEDDPRGDWPYVLRIDQAFDEHGCDVTALLAQYVAATLTLAADAEREQRRPSLFRRLADGIATFIGEAVGR